MKLKSKTYITVFFILNLLSACSYQTPNALNNITWHSLDEGIKRAAELNKKVFIYFRADWWHYCRKLDQVLARQKVHNYLNENFIAVKIDFDREKDIVHQFNVQGIPDIWFLDSKGEKLTRSTGYVSEDILIAMLKYISEEAFQKMGFKEFLQIKEWMRDCRKSGVAASYFVKAFIMRFFKFF